MVYCIMLDLKNAIVLRNSLFIEYRTTNIPINHYQLEDEKIISKIHSITTESP